MTTAISDDVRRKADGGGLSRRDFLRKTGTAVGLGIGLSLTNWERLFAQSATGVLDLMFVSTADDKSLSVIDTATDQLVMTVSIGTAFPFPANQWALTGHHLWGNAGDEVQVVDVLTGQIVKHFKTGSDRNQNYVGLTPDGRHAVLAARFTDKFLKVSADPKEPNFLEIVAEYQTYPNAGPCDTTVSPDGRFSFHPDRHSHSMSVLDLQKFEVVAVVPVEPLLAEKPDPFMSTVSPDGRVLFIENTEGGGTEGIWDVSNPLRPVEVARLTADDGLGASPLTSEFSLDGKYGFVICRNSNSVTVIDTHSYKVVDNVKLPEESNPISAGLSPDGRKLYIPLPGRDAVAVMRTDNFKVVDTIMVGARPLSAVPLRTREPEVIGSHARVGAMYAEGRPMPDG